MTLPALYWTIQDLPVDLAGDWRANVLAFGGYDQMSGVIPERIVRRHPGVIDQGATITAYDAGGAIRWQGQFTQPPKLDNGLAFLQAIGAILRARQAMARRFYQSYGYGDWVSQSSDPYAIAATDQKLRCDIEGGRIVIGEDAGTTNLALGDNNGAIRWIPGAGPMSRIAFSWTATQVVTDYDIRIFTGPGPGGPWTLRSTINVAATAGTADVTTTAPDTHDAIRIQLYRNAAFTGTLNGFKLVVTNLRVNGVAVGDSMDTGAIAADLGGVLGYDTSLAGTSGVNGLPFDLTGSWADNGLLFLPQLTDWRCLVLEDRGRGPFLDFGPWATKWTVLRQVNATPDLEALPIYNQVIVKYATLAGALGQVVVDADSIMADPLSGTPLAGQKIPWVETLQDPQTDASLATAMANYLLPIVATPRFQGRIEIVGARADDGTGHAYAPRGGDVVTITDWAPTGDKQLRVWETQYTSAGASLGIEGPVSAEGLIAGINLKRARERRVQSGNVKLRAA